MSPNFIVVLCVLVLIIMFWIEIAKADEEAKAIFTGTGVYNQMDNDRLYARPYEQKTEVDMQLERQRFISAVLNGEEAFPSSRKDHIYDFHTLLLYLPDCAHIDLRVNRRMTDLEIRNEWCNGSLPDYATTFQDAAEKMANDAGYAI